MPTRDFHPNSTMGRIGSDYQMIQEEPREMRDMAEECVGRVKKKEIGVVEKKWSYGVDCAFKQDLDRKHV